MSGEPKETNVLELFEYMATCPRCGEDKFNIMVKAPNTAQNELVDIVGTQCVSCNHKMSWR